MITLPSPGVKDEKDKVLIFWTGKKNVAILNVHTNHMHYKTENIGVFAIRAKYPLKRDEDCAE
jgi:tRNA (Thr-GGU) A37 N-methylase